MKTGPIYSITEHEDKCDTATPVDASDVLTWNNTSEGLAELLLEQFELHADYE